MLRLPVLRGGRPYESLERAPLTDVRTGDAVAEASRANPGLVARDLRGAAAWQRRLAERSGREIVEACRRAAALFLAGELPLWHGDGAAGDGPLQSPDDYVRQLSATSGMPEALCRANMEKVRFVLAEMETVLAGLSRGLDLEVLDRGWGEESGRTVSYRREADAFGAVLPSNSPGVHSLWIPAVALQVPVVLKPGSREPWTPLRIVSALRAAGLPPEAASFYPTSHAGATEILLGCGRSMLFGDRATVGAWADDPRIELHGPGWSKVILGRDAAAGWGDHLELVAESVAANGGRSCVNASGLWIAAGEPGRGVEIARALAERLAELDARPLDDPEAGLAAFPEPAVAHRISEWIDRRLGDGARDLSAAVRGAERVAEAGGCTFLRPTVVWCDDPSHPLVEAELLFPFVTVVELPAAEIPKRLGPTLVASVVGDDEELVAAMLECTAVERLNLGPLATCRVVWDQPHEGNLFQLLYRQRAFQRAAGQERVHEMDRSAPTR